MIAFGLILDAIMAKAVLLVTVFALAFILTLSIALVVVRAQRDSARAELRRIQDQTVALETAVREAEGRSARERERTESILSDLERITPATSPAEAARRARDVARRLQR